MSNFFPTLPGFIAGGDVYPRRFIVADSTTARSVIQAVNATARPWGVTKNFTRRFPSDGVLYAAETKHAVSGEQVSFHPPGSIALLDLGGSVDAHALLVADSNGKGVAAASSGTTLQWIGAIALQAGVDGDSIEVWTVEAYPRRAALS